MIASKQIAFGRGSKRKPYDAEIEYLESTGTQHIDTGVIPDADTGIRICASSPVNTNDVYIAGLRNDNNQTRWCIGWSSDSKWYCGYGRQIPSYVGADKVDFRLNYLNDGKGIVGVFSTTLSKLTFVPAYNIRLFGSAGVADSYTSAQVKIYSATITQGSRIIVDLIPVRKGNIGYMYDRVSGQLFGNQGTGEFVLGPDINQDEVDYTAKDYIQDGLVAMWDGIENAGWGVHDPSIDRLVDLSGGGHDMTFVGEHEIGDSYVYIFGGAGAYGTVDGVNFGTPVTQEIIICASHINPYGRFIGEQRGLVYGASVSETGRIYGWGVDASIVKNRVEPLQIYCQSLVVDSGLNASYFFNGELKGECAVSTASQYSGQTSFFNRTSGGRGITGNLYNCRLYNRALTAEEIAHNYEIDKARFGL